MKIGEKRKNDTREPEELVKLEVHAEENEDLRENKHDYTPKQYQTLNRKTSGWGGGGEEDYLKRNKGSNERNKVKNENITVEPSKKKISSPLSN